MAVLDSITTKFGQLARELLSGDREVLETTARLGIAAGSISFLDDAGFVNVVASWGYSEALIQAFRRFSVNEPLPLAEAFRTGQSVWVATPEEHEARYPFPVSTFITEGERRGWAVIPFLLSTVLPCAFSMSFLRTHPLTPETRKATHALAQLIAQRLQARLDS